MFDTAHVNDSFGMSIPQNPYAAGRDDFFGIAADNARFRQQRLGVYLLSDLFTIGYMASSEFVRDKQLVTLARDKTMTYTGETFDQWDLDVLIYCVVNTSVVRGQAEKVLIEPGRLLRSMNLRNNDINRERVFSSLWRLHTGSLMIEGKGYRYMTRLIDRVLLDEHNGCCLVEVNMDVINSLRHECDLTLDIDVRHSLKRNGLAKWLHGAVMTFKGGFVADIDSLHSLTGAPARARHTFPARLMKALEILVANGTLAEWSIDDAGKVKVVPGCVRRTDSACGFISSSLF